uniref:Amine oxidase domain-containing protein n=1 Tax=Corethron hystrix TaxID=216773 RepID=A0A7S1B635_9STRA
MNSATAVKLAMNPYRFRVAIIGGGVSGCASARRLAQLSPSAEITLYEIGRGPGGRASTRKTRSHPHLYINHGSPYAEVRSDSGRSLLSSLGPSSVAPFLGARGFLNSDTGEFLLENSVADGDKSHYVTGANGEMSEIAASLIRGIPSIDAKYKTMVRGLSRAQNGAWELKDKHEQVIGTADWLVVAGSGIAHPRWSDAFGGAPPLIAAEHESPDPKLRTALDAIAEQQVSLVLAVFFSCSGSAAREWLSLEYDVADVEGSSVLAKVIIQGGTKNDGSEWCSVVLHSTEDFALQNTGVYGASSSAARVGDASSDSLQEESLIKKMAAALNEIPGVPAIITRSDESKNTTPSSSQQFNYDYGPVLHRWGNAFPKGRALPEDLSFLSSSQVAFCGDYVATSEHARFGSFESALLSGTVSGEKIAKFYSE